MITGQQTNKLYLANTLPAHYPVFYSRLSDVLQHCGISHSLIPLTKDIWAVDYMPVQVSANRFIQFKYYPGYLRNKKWLKTIPDVDAICRQMDLCTEKSEIILDGGNVIAATDKVIMCEKVFSENPNYSRSALTDELQRLFEAKIFFVPRQPGDYTGHADGMLRFIDDNTLLVNDYKNERAPFRRTFTKAIEATGLDVVELPYAPHQNPSQANGCYINYPHMAGIIMVPTFGLQEDEPAVAQFETLFKDHKITTVDANEIANQGGVLNCISWNILV